MYGARLKTGEDVVIKVQKPGVAEVLKTDLGFMYVTSKLVEVMVFADVGKICFRSRRGDFFSSEAPLASSMPEYEGRTPSSLRAPRALSLSYTW